MTSRGNKVTQTKMTLDEKIADWGSKLIDLSMSNKLLNYRMTKSATIIINGSEMKDIFNGLVLDRKTLSLHCEKFRDEFREDPSGGRECDLSNNVTVLNGREVPSTLNPNTEKVLRNLRSKSNLIRRERGVDALFVTFGTLNWKDEKDEVHMAPLLLAPVKLSRKGMISSYTIEVIGEEIVLNPALALKVRKEMNTDLPPLPDDLEGFSILDYLNSLAAILMKRNGWVVQIGKPLLGLFMFSKVVIYKDLRSNTDAIRQHPLLRALAGDLSRVPPEGTAPAGGELDPITTYQILEADSSQQEAVEAVKRGENLVLIGPPGTGKSQTIANIIAESLAKGKSVLFVAEKMAALEVVKRRLDSCGLGEFCLEMHSSNPTKQDVLESMLRPLEMVDHRTEGQDEFKLNHLRTVREELNAYVAMLHSPQGPMEMSAHHAYGELASLHDYPQIVFDLPGTLTFTRERMDSAEHAIQRLISSRSVLVEREIHPWRDCDLKNLGPAEQAELIVRLEDVFKEIEKLLAISSAFCPKAGMEVPKSLDSMRKFSALLSVAGGSPLPPRNWFAKGEAERLLDIAMKLLTATDESNTNEAYILTRYKKEFLDFDGTAYADRFEKQYTSFLRIFRTSYRIDMKAINMLSTTGKVGFKDARRDVLALRKYQRAKTLLADVEKNGVEWFGRYNGDMGKDVGPVISALRWTKSFMDMPGYDGSWVKVVAEGTELREDVVGNGPTALRAMKDLDLALGSARNLFVDNLRAFDGSSEMIRLRTFAKGHVDAKARLAEWVEFRETEAMLRAEGLGSLYEEVLKRQPALSDLKPMFRKRFFQLWLQELHAKEQALGRFNSSEHMDRISKYKQLDKDSREISKARLRKLLFDKIKNNRMNADERWRQEEGYLIGLKGSKKRPAVREMIARSPTVLGVAKPCFMMSPISVSQFLPPPEKVQFDVVIFDEASQIVPEDAICCILRGKQLVVVGDNRQLPPTRFFDRISETDDEDELEDLESILDECGTIGLKQRMLLWHYRSRQESLISFSNRHLYGGKLITTPSAEPSRPGEGIELIHVKDGVYDRGGRRDNRIEAAIVADTVIDQYLAYPEMSLGVVAFSVAQQDAVLDVLEYKVKAMSRDRPELANLFDDEGSEPFFVKNLENVQGDERDVMIFSVGYGKDGNGTMTLNFGPLNQEGGARRLNVAITRARRSVKVVSSIMSRDIQVGQNGPLGVVLLRDYLDHAESKGGRVAMTPQEIALSKSMLEGSIASALTARGHQVARNVGSSSIRVDVAVMDPAQKGRYLIGVLCDGTSYTAGRNARDREIVREGVLKNLGWNTIRVWSRDWALDRERTLDRIEEAVKVAIKRQADK
ncbi:MAG: DUF4011 domain-containing protein [Euryarchaeota archaeon]|nr:DUF4011 domain-containing protein [Euryarchaeota archaeon]